jgi:2'-5' RNA ligase
MSTLRYAVWYEPTGEVYNELKDLITKLSKQFHSPVFEPHITLLPGGTDMAKDGVIEKLQSYIEKSEQFTTKLTTFDFTDEYFKSIIIAVEQTQEIMSFGHGLQKEINDKQVDIYTPHLSVLYGNYPIKEKKAIQALGKAYDKSFVLEKIDVIEYELGKPPETWKKIAAIKFRK